MKGRIYSYLLIALMAVGCSSDAPKPDISKLGLNPFPSQVIRGKATSKIVYNFEFSCKRTEFVDWLTSCDAYYSLRGADRDQRELYISAITDELQRRKYGMFLQGSTKVIDQTYYIIIDAEIVEDDLVNVLVDIAKM